MRTRSVGPAGRALHRIVTWLFPTACPLCMRTNLWRPEDAYICAECASKTRLIRAPFCHRCGRPFKEGPSHECQNCLLDPPDFRYMRSAYAYQGPLRKALLAFKFHREISRASPLAGLLLSTELMGIEWENYDLVVPVPLHPNRLRRRGYNQCSLLLREIGKKRRILRADDALVRVRDTAPQFSVSPSQRPTNVAGAFACPEPSAVAGASILLVDDITTTGATLKECAKTLRKAKAAVVDAAALSRVVEL